MKLPAIGAVEMVVAGLALYMAWKRPDQCEERIGVVESHGAPTGCALQSTMDGVATTLVLGVPIANLDYLGVIDQVERWIRAGESRYIGVCPVHSIIEARRPEHRRVLHGAGLNTADGVPVVWAQRLLGHPAATRVYGPTLMLQTLERAAQRNWRVAFYGGHPDRLPLLIERLKMKFPGLQVVEAISPPFQPLTPEEDQAMVDRLNAARPDIIWVGLGCPKQERWMADHSPLVRGVMIGVGAAFDFHAGKLPQAPPVLQRFGLEWAFRLWKEPRRLFRRYATTNPKYVVLLAGQVASRYLLRRQYQLRPAVTEQVAM